jgi:putative glycosyl hydrolase-like family 15 (GHL15) protein
MRIRIVLFLMLASIVFAAEEKSQFSTRDVQLAWFYKPPANRELNVLATRYDFFVLTKSDEHVRDELMRLGVRSPILQYIQFEAIEDPGSCTAQPRHNQVADRAGDFCDIQRDHPEWLLKDKNGHSIVDGHSVLMDPGNKEWRRYWLDWAKQNQSQRKWSGIFLDNVEASFQKRNRKGIPRKYDASQYVSAIEGFLSYIYTSYSQPQNRPLFANIISLKQTDVWFRYIKYLDGAMIENFAADWRSRYKSVEEWKEDLNIAEKTQAMGKRIILVTQGQKDDQQRQLFGYASYLLVTNGRAAFRYAASDSYNQAWLYPIYQERLGAPVAPRFAKNGKWFRQFEHGTVSVDPGQHVGEIQTN